MSLKTSAPGRAARRDTDAPAGLDSRLRRHHRPAPAKRFVGACLYQCRAVSKADLGSIRLRQSMGISKRESRGR
jgi:hypothetical protein